jgi:hypothetical protein
MSGAEKFVKRPAATVSPFARRLWHNSGSLFSAPILLSYLAPNESCVLAPASDPLALPQNMWIPYTPCLWLKVYNATSPVARSGCFPFLSCRTLWCLPYYASRCARRSVEHIQRRAQLHLSFVLLFSVFQRLNSHSCFDSARDLRICRAAPIYPTIVPSASLVDAFCYLCGNHRCLRTTALDTFVGGLLLTYTQTSVPDFFCIATVLYVSDWDPLVIFRYNILYLDNLTERIIPGSFQT